MLVLAIDVGTHAARAAVIDSAHGTLLLSHSLPIGLRRLDARRVEQDPAEILHATQTAIANVLAQAESAGLTPEKAALATQRSTVLAWDRHSGAPLSAALSWQDTRGHGQLHQLQPRSAEIKQRSGLVLSPHYGATKLHWLLETLGAAWQPADVCLSPLVSFLLFNLLADRPCVCDESNAGRTQLVNLKSRAWDKQLCEWFAVPPEFLPVVRPVQCDYGQLAVSGVPLAAVCGDQNAAFFAFASGRADRALVNVGSGAFVLSACKGNLPAADDLLIGVYRSDDDSVDYVIEGTVNGAGTALSWCYEQRAESEHLSSEEFYRLLPQWLRQVSQPPLFLNSIGGLGSPWWRPGGEPVFVNNHKLLQPLSLAEQACAVVESILFLLCVNIQLMRQRQPDLHELVVTGGVARLDDFCQKLANVSGLMVVRPAEMEATAVGAAALATGAAPHPKTAGLQFTPQTDKPLQQRFNQFIARISA